MCLHSHFVTATKQKIVRAEGAQQNGFENLALFAAAVVIGNVAKLDNWTLNALSYGYLASRAIYNMLYITGTSDAAGKLTGAIEARGRFGAECSFRRCENSDLPVWNWHHLHFLHQGRKRACEQLVNLQFKETSRQMMCDRN